MKKTIEQNHVNSDLDDKYILELLENDTFYTLCGEIGNHKGEGPLNYNINIIEMSGPMDK